MGFIIGVLPISKQILAGKPLRVASQQNVDTPTSHIGSNGDRTQASCLGNNVSFSVVLFGVQNIMSYSPLI